MDGEIPTKMKSVRMTKIVSDFDQDLKEAMSVVEVDVPVPQNGQVLIKVHYSTVNPSDLSYMKNAYGKPLLPPCGAGFEGSGVVVANGGGLMGYMLIGKKVSFYGESSWSEYEVADAMKVVELNDDTPLEKAAGALVNPFTCLAFLEIAKTEGHTSLVHTAAASSLGRMLIRCGKKKGVEIVCVVRREEQAEICRQEGAVHVFNSSVEGWQAEFSACVQSLNTTLCFDAVSGDFPGTILAAMPNNSTAMVYGGLGGNPLASANTAELLFRGKTLKGFWLRPYLDSKTIMGKMLWMREIKNMIESDLGFTVSKTISLDEIVDGVLFYTHNMTAGKVLVKIAA